MRIIKEFSEITRDLNSVITIGTFDGIHLAHQKIIAKLIQSSKEKRKRSILITFEPHPRKVIDKGFNLHILTTLEEKADILQKIDPDFMLVIKFDNDFAKIEPLTFIKEILYEKIGFNEMVLGFDHGFGNNRGGNIDLLEKLKSELFFSTDVIEPVVIDDEKVSSTVIRHALMNGNLKKANHFLGRPYRIDGDVIRGDERGRTIGYPTANLHTSHQDKLIPKTGVYFVKIYHKNDTYYGCMNIGTRPTFTDSNQVIIETYIFNFNKDIYGDKLRIEFLNYLREEKKFDSKDSLLWQLEQDKKHCFEIINNINHN
jgi:riboflavin kinase / FMN adenylyltransferase